MTDRWQQGTNDQDGDGHKGGSISIAEAQRRAEQKEAEMATVEELEKKADALKIDRSAIKGTGADGNVLKADLEKAIADAEKKAPKSDDAAKPAPSQPWARPSAETAPAVPADNVPSEAHDQLTPTGDPDAAHEQARDEAAGGNGGGTPGDVPSELVDQHTPTGPSPEQVDERAEAGTPDSSPNRVDAEAKDQETPTGEDLSSTLHAQFSELSEDERSEFETFMSEQAAAKLDQLTKGRRARAMEVSLVDGASHYGKRIPQPRRKELEA